MTSLNKVTLIGNLGRDPETRYSADGAAVTNCSIATTDKWIDKSTREKREATEWHRLVMFGRLAEVAGEYLRKGSSIYVEGKLVTRSYEKDGITRYVTEIRVSELKMLGRKGEDGEHTEAPAEPAAPRTQAPAKTDGGIGDMDDDIPF